MKKMPLNYQLSDTFSQDKHTNDCSTDPPLLCLPEAGELDSYGALGQYSQEEDQEDFYQKVVRYRANSGNF